MNDTQLISWGALIVAVILLAGFHVRRSLKLYQTAPQDRVPANAKLLFALIFILVGLIGFIVTQPPAWLAITRPNWIQLGFLFSYSANMSMANGKAHSLRTSKLTIFVAVVAVVSIVLGILSLGNLGSIASRETYRTSVPHTLYYALNVSSYTIVLLCVARAIWTSISIASELTFRVRRIIGFVAMILTAFGLLMVLLDVVTTAARGDSAYRPVFAWIFFVLSPMALLLPIGHALPQPLLARATQPLRRFLGTRRARQLASLSYLQNRMLRIAPNVPRVRAPVRDPDVLFHRAMIEIDEAREVIWSQQERTQPVSFDEEAQHLAELLYTGVVLPSPGNYSPPPITTRNVIRHNIAVAKLLHRIEAEQMATA